MMQKLDKEDWGDILIALREYRAKKVENLAVEEESKLLTLAEITQCEIDAIEKIISKIDPFASYE